MDLGLKGKLALVTASSGGLGRSIADGLAAEGANLVLFARSKDKLQELARRRQSVTTSRSSLRRAACSMRRTCSALPPLSRTSGVQTSWCCLTGRPPTPLRPTLEETEQARWDEAYRNQLSAVVEVVNGVVPLMLGRDWGRIIAVTSAHAKQPVVGHALSTVFRAGRDGLHEGAGGGGCRRADHRQLRCSRTDRLLPPHRRGGVHRGADRTSPDPHSPGAAWEARRS